MIKPITKFPTWVYANAILPMYLGGGRCIKIERIVGKKHSKKYEEDMYRYDIEVFIGKECFVRKSTGKNERAYFPYVLEGSNSNFTLLSKARPATLKKIFRTIFNQ